MAVTRRTARPRFTVIVLVLVSLTLITLDVRGGNLVPGLRGRVRDVFSPVQTGVSSATRPVTDFFHGIFEYGQLKADNAHLRQQLAELQARQIQDAYLQQTNKDLSDLLKLPFVGDIPFIGAPVIAGAESNFQLTIVIGRGSAAGILKGMPVVAGSGLVGRVTAVSKDQATVLLLTDPSANVGIQIDGAVPSVGVATGQGAGRSLAVTLVDPGASVPVGAGAVTSGLVGSPYPRGISVGTVASSTAEVGVQAHTITLTPVVDLAKLSYVDVLVWTPQTPREPGSTGGVATPPATTTTVPPTTSTFPATTTTR